MFKKIINVAELRAALVALALGGCAERSPEPAEPSDFGLVALPLAMAKASGEEYRFHGSIEIVDSEGAVRATVQADEGSPPEEEVALLEGTYSTKVVEGYSCSYDGPAEFWGCTFTGANPDPFEVESGATTEVMLSFIFHFATGDEVIPLRRGGSAVFVLAPEDQITPICGEVECASDEVCAALDDAPARCYRACEADADCPANERCVLAGTPDATQMSICHGGVTWTEEFEDPTLSEQWTVVAGGGNSFSLTAIPGALRYGLGTTARTHADGFLTAGAPYPAGAISCCEHVAGLDLLRELEGERWSLEARVTYHLPGGAGRRFDVKVYFGEAGSGYPDPTQFIGIGLWVDVGVAFFHTKMGQATGPSFEDQAIFVAQSSPVASGEVLTADLRFERSGGVLSAQHSLDGGESWATSTTQDFGDALQARQTLSLSGMFWGGTGAADIHWVRFAQQ